MWHFQAAEKAFKFYNKHLKNTENYSAQFERLKLVANDVREESKLTLKDIGKLSAHFLEFQASS